MIKTPPTANMLKMLDILESHKTPMLTTEKLAELIGLTNQGAVNCLSNLFKRQLLIKTRIAKLPLAVTLPLDHPFGAIARETRWFVPSRTEEAVSFRFDRNQEARAEFAKYKEKENDRV